MALDLPPKDAPKDEVKVEAKPKPTSTAALSSRVGKLEKLVGLIADSHYGKNVRPALPDDDAEENSE